MNSRDSAGYTIVEVLIVLAVTSALFIAAGTTFSGRQARTEFTTGLRSLESTIQTVANDVASGYYDNGYRCTTSPGSPPQLNGGAAAAPGTNIDCIFLGKVMQFGLSGGKMYNVYTVVGRRQASSTQQAVTTLEEARPKAVDGSGSSPDVTAYKTTDWGVRITRIIHKGVGGGPNTDVGGFGFLNQLTGDIAGGNPATGSRSVELVGIAGSTLAMSKPPFVARLEATSPAPGMADATGGIVVCVRGANDQKGQIDVGGGRGRLTTNVLVDSAVSSDC